MNLRWSYNIYTLLQLVKYFLKTKHFKMPPKQQKLQILTSVLHGPAKWFLQYQIFKHPLSFLVPSNNYIVTWALYTQAHFPYSSNLSTQKVEKHPRWSHSIVGWSATTLGHNPVDVLARVLDVTGLTVDTVLSINLQPHPITCVQGNILVHTWVFVGERE